MPSKRRDITIPPEEQRAFLETARTVQVASIGPDGRPHLVPMWFVVDDEGCIVFTTYATSQKVRNLQRDPRITALVEDGREYSQLRGLMIEGRAELVMGDPEATAAVRRLIGAKYAGRTSAAPRSDGVLTKRCVVRIRPERVRSWDHSRLAAG
jgi:PPOX class probable F420-dependent enzyme